MCRSTSRSWSWNVSDAACGLEIWSGNADEQATVVLVTETCWCVIKRCFVCMHQSYATGCPFLEQAWLSVFIYFIFFYFYITDLQSIWHTGFDIWLSAFDRLMSYETKGNISEARPQPEETVPSPHAWRGASPHWWGRGHSAWGRSTAGGGAGRTLSQYGNGGNFLSINLTWKTIKGAGPHQSVV